MQRQPTQISKPALRSRGAGARQLARLDALRQQFGPTIAAERLALLRALEGVSFGSAAQLQRLHDTLCFALAFPDSAALRALARRMLRSFDQRSDFHSRRRALADTGIAGTDTHFRFFAPMALHLSRRFPSQLVYDWPQWDDPARLAELLPLLAAYGETPALDEWNLGLRGWLSRMIPRGVGDAAFVARRLARSLPDSFAFEKIMDGIDAPMVLRAGRQTPARSRLLWSDSRVCWQKKPLRRERPDLRTALAGAGELRVRPLPPREAGRMIDLALDVMVSYGRDLDVFSYGDRRDVRLVDCGAGLQFVAIGALPERRLLLEAFYGFLMLKNGVPIGYLGASALYGSAEIIYNMFETFRGGEAAWNFASLLAMARRLFGVDAFTLYPYQLGGDGNDEGLESGAWWFYRKLGFEPLEREARRLMKREEARMARDPAYRSGRTTLQRLAAHNVYWFLDRRRRDIMGLLPLANIGLAVTDKLARYVGRDVIDDRGAGTCAREAVKLLGAGPARGWSAGERLAFDRWAPLVLLLPGVARWSPAEKRALVAVMRVKGGRRESDFVRAFDTHPRLRAALSTLARSTGP